MVYSGGKTFQSMMTFLTDKIRIYTVKVFCYCAKIIYSCKNCISRAK